MRHPKKRRSALVCFSSWGWLQEGIDQYNKLFKATVLNQKESWASDFEMDVVESLKE
jgi:hypothetical protein